jgi:hypothetical protein
MALDKNLAALLNENARTVQVQFQHALGETFQAYTYVTDLPISPVTAEGGQTKGLVIGSKVLVPTKIAKADTPASRYNPPYNTDPTSTMLLEPGVRISVAIITGIDECVKIEPEDDKTYGWVIGELDVSNYFKTKERNETIIALVQEQYTQNLRRSFANTILAGLGDDARGKVQMLLTGGSVSDVNAKVEGV